MKHKINSLRLIILVPVLLGVFLIVSGKETYAQEEAIEGIGPILSEAATQYVNPLMPAVNANMNSGWFQSMPGREKHKFSIEFGLTAIGTQINMDFNNINVAGRYYFSQGQAEEYTESVAEYPDIRSQVVSQLVNDGIALNLDGGNVTGGRENITLHYGENDKVAFAIDHEDYPFPVYVNLEAEPTQIEAGAALSGLKYLPGAFPQLKIGTLYGSQLILRGTPPIKIDDEVGDFSFIGIGVMHNPLIWLPETLPFQGAFGLMWQSSAMGDYVDMKTFSLAGMGGYQYQLGWLNIIPQLGFVTDKTKLEFNYNESIDVPGGEEEIEVNMILDEKIAIRTFLGLHIKLAPLNLFGRYYLSGEQGIAGGLSFSF